MKDNIIIDHEEIKKTYKSICSKNKTVPISNEELLSKLLVISLSLLCACLKDGKPGFARFPLDDKSIIWCLIVPDNTYKIQIVFGTKSDIEDLTKKIMEDNVTSNEVISSISQF